MPPRPSPDRVAAAKDRITAAKGRRDQAVAAADRDLWTEVAALIAAGDLLQKDAADVLSLSRERIRQQIRAHTTETQ